MRSSLLPCLIALLAGLFSVGTVQAADPVLGALKLETADGQGFWLSSVSFHTETTVVEHKVVTEQGDVIQKIPGRLMWGDVEISRPVSADTEWAQWRKQVEDGNVEGARQGFSIVAYTPDYELLAQWDFEAGWPSRLGTLNISTNGPVEQMRLVHEGLTRITLQPNQPPAISLRSSYSTPVGTTTSFPVSASDPDGDPVTLSKVLAPAGATFSGGVFSWSVPLSALDSAHTVSFKADDQQGTLNSITTKQLTITVPRDFDADSMDDDWEIIWLGSLSAQAGSDADGDLSSNLHEFTAGTNPTNAASRFIVTDMAHSNATLWIQYTAEPGINYQLECNTNGLAAGTAWHSAGSARTEVASGSTNRLFSAPVQETDNAFYRIRAWR